jgi:pimeloyl-ACP methyl ester carboxylesterase
VNVLTLGATDADRVVLFAAGGGGDPERHRPLLERLAAHGCHIVAPRFERIVGREPTTPELLARTAGLVAALQEGARADVPVAGIGHSIGGWAVLSLAGATPWGRDGRPIEVPREPRLSRLALYAPATGWFRAPGALDHLTAPMLVYAGDVDTITPVDQILHLRTAPVPVDLRIVPGAGHFSFMDVATPGTSDRPSFHRARLLDDLAATTTEFVTRPVGGAAAL